MSFCLQVPAMGHGGYRVVKLLRHAQGHTLAAGPCKLGGGQVLRPRLAADGRRVPQHEQDVLLATMDTLAPRGVLQAQSHRECTQQPEMAPAPGSPQGPRVPHVRRAIGALGPWWWYALLMSWVASSSILLTCLWPYRRTALREWSSSQKRFIE